MKRKKRLFALFGNPVAQSLSPLMHNAAYKAMKLDARYIAIRKEKARDIAKEMALCNIEGASVTIPHKTALFDCIDSVSDSALKIGAVNTLTFHNGTLKGDNTDWTGFVHAVEMFTTFKGNTFIVLGAGGAARAALFAILKKEGRAVIVNRTQSKGESLGREFGCDFFPLKHLGALEGHCLINCTSAGMHPLIDRSPIEGSAFPRCSFVMDMIYNPLKTKLCADADHAGIPTVTGLSMFVHQGADQIRLWTKLEPPVELMRHIAERALSHEAGQ